MALLCGAAYYSAGMATGFGFGLGRETAKYALTCVPAFMRTSVYDVLGVVSVDSRDALQQQVNGAPELSRAACQTIIGMCTSSTIGLLSCCEKLICPEVLNAVTVFRACTGRSCFSASQVC